MSIFTPAAAVVSRSRNAVRGARKAVASALLVSALLAGAPTLAAAAAAGDPADLPAPPPHTLPSPSPLRLVINVPAYRLDAFLDERRVATWPVTIGSPREPSPTGQHQIARLTWNPWWYPTQNTPKDVITPPGPTNPMGRVKFHIASDFYVHGTALSGEIGRATSRGCVRLRNADAIALARLIHANAGVAATAAEIEGLVRNPKRTRHLALEHPVRVEMVYALAEVRDGLLHLHKDVYRELERPLFVKASLYDRALAALVASGVAAPEVDGGKLAALVARRGTKPVAIAEVLTAEAVLARSGSGARPQPAARAGAPAGAPASAAPTGSTQSP